MKLSIFAILTTLSIAVSAFPTANFGGDVQDNGHGHESHKEYKKDHDVKHQDSYWGEKKHTSKGGDKGEKSDKLHEQWYSSATSPDVHKRQNNNKSGNGDDNDKDNESHKEYKKDHDIHSNNGYQTEDKHAGNGDDEGENGDKFLEQWFTNHNDDSNNGDDQKDDNDHDNDKGDESFKEYKKDHDIHSENSYWGEEKHESKGGNKGQKSDKLHEQWFVSSNDDSDKGYDNQNGDYDHDNDKGDESFKEYKKDHDVKYENNYWNEEKHVSKGGKKSDKSDKLHEQWFVSFNDDSDKGYDNEEGQDYQ